MSSLARVEHEHKETPQSWASKCVWFLDYEINTHEFVRAEILQARTRTVIDVRRWRKLPDGSTRSTGKGVALAARHLPALKHLIDAALAEGHAKGLLNDGGVACP
jgi:hypothetical protein